MADDDWDEEELLMVTGRSTKAGKKRSRKAEESDEDEEQPARAQKAAGGKRQRAAPAPAAADSDDEDEDGMDAEERRKLDAMNELEREMYLFEREEKLQRERERKQVEVRASSRRPRTQTGTDSAIGRIAAAHAQREAREKKKQQEEEERQGKQQRARPSRKQQEDDEEEDPVEEEEEAASDDEEDEEMQEADDDEEEEEAELAALDEDEDELMLAGDKQQQQQLVRAEEYDEGAGYEESEEHASLEEVRSIQLRRSNLEAWHNEPFFEDDVRGCVLRLSVPTTPEQQRAGQTQQTYMLVRVVDVVVRNSYPFGKPGARTRKWLHLDDLSGNPVFRYQMAMDSTHDAYDGLTQSSAVGAAAEVEVVAVVVVVVVVQVSNQEIEQSEYHRSLDRSKRSNGKFITKGDIHAAKQHLEHARTFKYNPELVKKLLEKKRAAGKMTGSAAQVRARLRHEINLARQEGKSEDDVQRLQDELDRLDQQEQRRQQEVDEIIAAASAKDKESAAAVAAAAAASQSGSKLSADMALALINMRNRDKNNYKVLGAAAAGKKQPATAEVNSSDVFSRRHTQSKVYWATKGNKKDAESVERRQQDMAGRSLLTLDDWKRKMSYI
eukprot:gene6279-6518_t